MVTCYLRYTIDPHKLAEFEEYTTAWIPVLERLGGKHHGVYLPHEGANNMAISLFSFQTLAAYEQYRIMSQSDAECIALYALEKKNRSFLSVERSFMRPVFSKS